MSEVETRGSGNRLHDQLDAIVELLRSRSWSSR